MNTHARTNICAILTAATGYLVDTAAFPTSAPGLKRARRLDSRGAPGREIARRLGIGRASVAKYADREDFSPVPAEPQARPEPRCSPAWSTLSRRGSPRTNAGTYSPVQRFVKQWTARNRSAGEGFTEPVWRAGTAAAAAANTVLANEDCPAENAHDLPGQGHAENVPPECDACWSLEIGGEKTNTRFSWLRRWEGSGLEGAPWKPCGFPCYALSYATSAWKS